MSLVTGSIANLVSGVSQQPASIRLSSQGEIQVNGLSSVAEGLRKRPPASHIARIGTVPVADRFIHVINRDLVERYIVIVGGGDLKVYDINGVQKTVAFPAGKGYLTHTGVAQQAFRAVTIADTTFLINTERTVSKMSTLTAAPVNDAVVEVRAGNYGRAYRIFLNGTQAAVYTTPDGSVAAHSLQIDTAAIATQLMTSLTASAASFPGFTYTRTGASIYITRTSDFAVSTEDGFNGAALKATKKEVQRFADLPLSAPNNFTVEIVGQDGNKADNYYTKFITNSTGGLWKESAAPGIQFKLDPTTMPFVLTREATGDFTFQQIAWSDRLVGDDASAPFPSFTSRKITDMFFYRNRLGFLSDENVIFSEAGKFYNFFPTTVTAVLDSDTIDVGVSHTKVSLLRFAVPFAENLILFSGQTQFKVNAGDKLTPATISIDQTTEFECSTKAKPVGAGNSVYFEVPRGAYSGFKEYFVKDDRDSLDAEDVTAHVPNFIPQDVFKMAAATNEDILIALAESTPNRVYVYKYFIAGQEKLQSSWSYWEFAPGDVIVNAEFIESDLYLLISRSDGLYVESLRVSPGSSDVNSKFLVHLDRKHLITSVSYDAITNRTSFATPFPYMGTGWAVVVAEGGSQPHGQVADVRVDSTTSASVLGNLSGTTLFVGKRYTFQYRFTTLMIRQEGQGGQKSVQHGRLQLLRMGVTYANTGFFRAKVYNNGNPVPFTSTFTGKILGSINAKVGAVSLETGVFYFPVKTKNTNAVIDIESDSPYPCTFLSAQWEGQFTTRAREV